MVSESDYNCDRKKAPHRIALKRKHSHRRCCTTSNSQATPRGAPKDDEPFMDMY